MANVQDVKDWFMGVRRKQDAIYTMEDTLKRIRSRATNTAVSISGMPGGSTVSDKTGLAAEITDMEHELEQARKELFCFELEATRRTGCLCSPEQAEALYEYYVNRKTQEQVAAIQGVGDSAVRGRIRIGLEALAEIWEDIEADQFEQTTL